MTMTPQQAASIREAAQAAYRELFGPADAAQLQAVGEIIAPAWRQLEKERRESAEAGGDRAA